MFEQYDVNVIQQRRTELSDKQRELNQARNDANLLCWFAMFVVVLIAGFTLANRNIALSNSYVSIGMGTLCAIAALLGGLLWLANKRLATLEEHYNMLRDSLDTLLNKHLALVQEGIDHETPAPTKDAARAPSAILTHQPERTIFAPVHS